MMHMQGRKDARLLVTEVRKMEMIEANMTTTRDGENLGRE